MGGSGLRMLRQWQLTFSKAANMLRIAAKIYERTRTPPATGELAEIVKRHGDCYADLGVYTPLVHSDIGWLINALTASEARVKFLEKALTAQNVEICQTLGAVLGYPWLKDDQANFPGATEKDGVCVGDHVAESIAVEAAKRITKLEARVKELQEALRSCGIRQSSVEVNKLYCQLCGELDDVVVGFRHKPTCIFATGGRSDGFKASSNPSER